MFLRVFDVFNVFSFGRVVLYTVFIAFPPQTLVNTLAKNLVKNLAKNLIKHLVQNPVFLKGEIRET